MYPFVPDFCLICYCVHSFVITGCSPMKIPQSVSFSFFFWWALGNFPCLSVMTTAVIFWGHMNPFLQGACLGVELLVCKAGYV
jgi:hypothetical protein